MSSFQGSTRRALAVLLAFAGLSAAMPAAPSAVAWEPGRSPTPFVLRDSFWANLHHFLYVLGRAKNGERDAMREATIAAPAEVAAARLPEAERRAWEECVSDYAAGLSKRDPIFDAALARFTLELLRVPDDAARLGIALEPEAVAILEMAAPIYRTWWYPSHRAENRRLVSELTPLIDAHAPALVSRMERAWERTWPAEGVPILVSGYTNWAGAYSTTGPLVVVASCPEILHGKVGLEALLHESLHQWDQRLLWKLDEAGKRVGAPVPDDLWHALIFYSTGHAARLEFGDRYGTYAEIAGIWSRRMGRFLPALESHWKPFLDGAGTLDEALDAILNAVR